MSKQRMIDTRFWNDTWVMDHLSQKEMFLFLYLMANEKTNLAGVYELNIKTICLEFKDEPQEVARILQKLRPKVIYHNGWVVLQNVIKYQAYQNPKITTGIISALKNVPKELLQYISVPEDSKEIKEFISQYSTPDNPLDIDSVSKPIDGLSHVIRLNVIELDSIKPNADKPLKPEDKVFKKTVKTPEQKKAYAIAAQADRDLEARKRNEPERAKRTTVESIREGLAKRGIVKPITEGAK